MRKKLIGARVNKECKYTSQKQVDPDFYASKTKVK